MLAYNESSKRCDVSYGHQAVLVSSSQSSWSCPSNLVWTARVAGGRPRSNDHTFQNTGLFQGMSRELKNRQSTSWSVAQQLHFAVQAKLRIFLSLSHQDFQKKKTRHGPANGPRGASWAKSTGLWRANTFSSTTTEYIHIALIGWRMEERSQELSGEPLCCGRECTRMDSAISDPSADSLWEVLAPA